MSNLPIIIIWTLTIISIVTAEDDRSDWINPHDMISYGAPENEIKKETNAVLEYNQEQKCDQQELALQKCETKLTNATEILKKCINKPATTKEKLDETYFKQYINGLLRNHFHHNAAEGGDLLYTTEILLHADDLDLLREFAFTEKGNIQDAHSVLSKMIQHSQLMEGVSAIHHSKVFITQEVKDIILSIFQMSAIATLLSLSVTLMVKLKVSLCQLLFKLFIVLFLISVPWNWMNMYKKAVAKQQVAIMQDMPSECHKEELTYAQKLWSALQRSLSLSSDPCSKYYESLLVSPMSEVAPTQALAVTISKFLVEPMEHIGKASGKLIRETLSELPVHLWPVALFFIITVTIIVLILSFGYQIKLFHVFGIEPGRKSPIPQLQTTKECLYLENRVQELTKQVEQLTNKQDAALEYSKRKERNTTKEVDGGMECITKNLRTLQSSEELLAVQNCDAVVNDMKTGNNEAVSRCCNSPVKCVKLQDKCLEEINSVNELAETLDIKNIEVNKSPHLPKDLEIKTETLKSSFRSEPTSDISVDSHVISSSHL